MVEYERRDVHPGRSRRRLRRYSRYIDEGPGRKDHGSRPITLFVFDNDRAEGRFLEAAYREQPHMRLLTSNRNLLSGVNPAMFLMANAWRLGSNERRPNPRVALAGLIHKRARRLLFDQRE